MSLLSLTRIHLRNACLLLAAVLTVSAGPLPVIAIDPTPELGRSSGSRLAYPPLIAQPATLLVNDSGEHQQLSIVSIDHNWTIELQPNHLLGSIGEVQEALFDLPDFFQGSVSGDEQSWVRLTQQQRAETRTDGSTAYLEPVDSQDELRVFTGHIHTAGALYELQYRDDMGGYALAQVSDSPLDLPSSLSSRASDSTALAPHAIKIGIAVDSLYNEHHNGRGLAHALGIINGVDGLYQDQLGLAVVVENFRVYEDVDSDPLRNSAAEVEQLLADYRDIRTQDSELPAELALVHLFSGHGDPDKVIGLGWISSACRLDGYDLSMSTPFPYDMLLAAHEIAHNLGAPHDDDTQCNSDTSITGTEVMWSELSGNTRPSFSSCSLNEMSKVFEASCVAENIDASIALMSEPTGNAFEQRITVSVANNDLTRNASLLTSVTTFPPNTVLSQTSAGCTVNQQTLVCGHETLTPGQTSNLTVTAAFTQFSIPVLSSELIVDDFIDTRTNNNRVAIQIDASSTTDSTSILSGGDADNQSFAIASSDQPGNDQAMFPDRGGSAGIGSISPAGLGAGAMLFSSLVFRRRWAG